MPKAKTVKTTKTTASPTDPLEYRVTRTEEGDVFTSFKLATGSKLKLGNETLELATDTDILFIRGEYSRDAIVDLLVSTGNASVNAHLLSYTEERDGQKYRVTYGGRGQRYEELIAE